MRASHLSVRLGASLLSVALGFAPQALAQAATNGPSPLGVFAEWTAATYVQGGQTICYAFTRPTSSTPTLSGRGEVLLSLTERPGARDEAALSTGFTYAKGANVLVAVGGTNLAFYTAGNAAFARDGEAAVQAFKLGYTAVAHSPGPGGRTVTDSFSLRGFSDAYAAITKACPAK
ncbi:MAG TPA: invasion associated locus B family protein [Acetobacteraceae bacterium]|nr:invasion associated locus B family protein [Acetobacteraceae bacterium]